MPLTMHVSMQYLDLGDDLGDCLPRRGRDEVFAGAVLGADATSSAACDLAALGCRLRTRGCHVSSHLHTEVTHVLMSLSDLSRAGAIKVHEPYFPPTPMTAAMPFRCLDTLCRTDFASCAS